MAERPRDRLGRPVPADSPRIDATPLPSIEGLEDDEVGRLAWTCYAEGRPFHAHEVCEMRWRTCPEGDRPLWRALAQWAAAETHLARGNLIGAHRLAERALDALEPAATDVPRIIVDDARDRCARILAL